MSGESGSNGSEGLNGLTVCNRGRCGQNSGVVRERFGEDVLQLDPKPDYVLIYIGMNDVINDRFFTPLAAYIENVSWMVERARAAGLGVVTGTCPKIEGRKRGL